MADFVSDFWSVFIAVATIISIIACAVLLYVQSTHKVANGVNQTASGAPASTSGHVWDEDITEYNNPMPGWWIWMFYLTIFFSAGYLVMYPGLGAFRGSLGWTSAGEHADEMKQAEAEYGPLFAQFAAKDLKVVAADPQARAIGERLFLNTCAQCHGSDARGSKGFPNLADTDWLWGGTPDLIKQTIMEGRTGMMPPLGAALGGDTDVRNVANYVLSLSGSAHDSIGAALGKPKFAVCAACHGADGKGNIAMGAPNLTDKVWLHGGGIENVAETISKGRNNQMPAHKDFLGDAKAHVLAAYVWGLSNDTATPAAAPAAAAKK